jgi:hypothetical protein
MYCEIVAKLPKVEPLYHWSYKFKKKLFRVLRKSRRRQRSQMEVDVEEVIQKSEMRNPWSFSFTTPHPTGASTVTPVAAPTETPVVDAAMDAVTNGLGSLNFAPSNVKQASGGPIRRKTSKKAAIAAHPYSRLPPSSSSSSSEYSFVDSKVDVEMSKTGEVTKNSLCAVDVRALMGDSRKIDLSSRNWRLENLSELIRVAYGENCAIDSIVVAGVRYNDMHPIDDRFWRDLERFNRIHVIGHYNCQCPKRVLKMACRPYSGF